MKNTITTINNNNTENKGEIKMTKKRTGKFRRAIASVMAGIMMISAGAAISTTAASAATVTTTQAENHVAIDIGLTVIGKFVSGGSVISPILKSIIGAFQKKGPSIGDVRKDIEKLRTEMKEEFNKIKQKMEEDTMHIESKIIDQTVIATKGNTFDDLLVALKETADQINTINKDKSLTENEKAIEINALIGSNSQWNQKNNLFFGIKSLLHVLSDATFSDTKNRDIYQVIFNDFAHKALFSGEAMNKAAPYINRLMLLNCYAYTLSAQCLDAAMSVSHLTNAQVKALSSIERAKYKSVVSRASLVENEIEELNSKSFDVDRKDSVATHYKNYMEQSKTVFINYTKSHRELSADINCQIHARGRNREAWRNIAHILRNEELSTDEVRLIIDHIKKNYSDTTIRSYLKYVGFNMDNVPWGAKMCIKNLGVFSRMYRVFITTLWWEDITKYTGVSIDDGYFNETETEICRTGENHIPTKESDWDYAVDGYILGFRYA